MSANAMAFQTKAEEVDEKVAGAREKFIEEQLAKMRGDQSLPSTEVKTPLIGVCSLLLLLFVCFSFPFFSTCCSLGEEENDQEVPGGRAV